MKIIIYFPLLLLIGCAAQNYMTSRDKYYQVIYIDNDNIDGYNIIMMTDEYNSKFILLSPRRRTNAEKPPFAEYGLIKIGNLYKMKLVPQDTAYVVRQSFIANRKGTYKVFMGDEIFIQNDTIKTKVYRSKDVFDRFVRVK